MRLWPIVLCIYPLVLALVLTGCKKTEEPSVAPTDEDNPGAAAANEKATPEHAAASAPPAPAAKKPQAVADAETEKTDEEAPPAASDEEEARGAANVDIAPELGSPFLLNRDGLRISGLILAKGYEKPADGGKRAPVDPGFAFPCDDRKVFVIVDMDNPNDLSGEIKVGWINPGSDKEGNAVTMSVPPKKEWRTFAFNSFTNKKPGLWQVVIRDSDDTVLARASFEMKDAE